MEDRDNNDERYSTMRSDLPMRTGPPVRRETTLRTVTNNNDRENTEERKQ